MLNLALALIPVPYRSQIDSEEGFLGKLILWGRRKVLFNRALRELHQLDDRDLDDLVIGRADFPELAWRHVIGAEPLMRPYR
jgi:uncharacterized protein YjiS (DUF1127 family)